MEEANKPLIISSLFFNQESTYNLSMFLDKNLQNRYTIGKYLRKQKGLRKKDPTGKRIPLPEELKQYKEDLMREGMKIGHMELGSFETKNGLKYSGFIATQDIPTNTVLLRVPVHCLLTTRDAYFSQIQKVFHQNPTFYAKAFTSDWQDRILLTYLLYEYQKGRTSKWFHLIRNLPKEIDYVVFWEDEELEVIEDSWVRRSILKEREKVVKEQDELIKIAAKYPEYFDMGYFTRENIRWIHVHLVTRCFGKYFQYTTMVPYAELFNHECTDVYYTMAYNPTNPYDTKEQLDPPKTLTPQQADEMESSDGSYDASDVAAEDEYFEEGQVQIAQLGGSWMESDIRSIESYLAAFISFNDGVSLPFLAKVFQQMDDIRSLQNEEEQCKKRLEKVHLNNVKYLKLVKQFYHKLDYNTYRYGVAQKKKWKENKGGDLEVDANADYFEGPWKKDKFDEFLMVCSSKDQYQEGSQVYFCYGRLPNRLLLMRYGIALEHNKYDHLFIRIDISQLVHASKPLQRYVTLQIDLKKYRKFKVKRTAFCVELLTFHRCLLWSYAEDPQNIFYVRNIERQIKALRLMESTLAQRLSSYKYSITHNQQRLKDKAIGYHQYFAIVYTLEHQRILHEQLNMINYAIKVLLSIQNGQTLESILRPETNQSNLRYQLMMATYFHTFRFEHWKQLA